MKQNKPVKRIVVTGGWGFIGSRFILKALQNTKYTIRTIDKKTYAANPSRVYNNLSMENNFRLEHLTKDICDVTTQDLRNCEYLINFAAESHVDNSIKDGKPFIRSNVEGVFNLLEAAKRCEGLKKFIQISTDEVYGDMYNLRGSQNADEGFPLRPSSYYSASKASADLLVQAAARTFDVPYVITRSCNNFGPGQDPEKLLPKIFKCIEEEKNVPVYGDGLQSREWIHVDDNVEIILELMLSAAEDEVYNIGSGYHYRNMEIIKYLSELLNKPLKLKHVEDRLGHDKVYRLDSRKTSDFLGDRVFQTLEGFLKDEARRYNEFSRK